MTTVAFTLSMYYMCICRSYTRTTNDYACVRPYVDGHVHIRKYNTRPGARLNSFSISTGKSNNPIYLALKLGILCKACHLRCLGNNCCLCLRIMPANTARHNTVGSFASQTRSHGWFDRNPPSAEAMKHCIKTTKNIATTPLDAIFKPRMHKMHLQMGYCPRTHWGSLRQPQTLKPD